MERNKRRRWPKRMLLLLGLVGTGAAARWRLRPSDRDTYTPAGTWHDAAAPGAASALARSGSSAEPEPGDAPPPDAGPPETRDAPPPDAGPPETRDAPPPDARLPANLADLTRDELYELAKRSDVPGRSKMSKEELVEALEQRR